MHLRKKKSVNTQINESVYLQHTRKYTSLLDAFIINTKVSNWLKIILKVLFFITIIVIMLALGLLFAYSVCNTFSIIRAFDTTKDESSESIIGAVVSIIPSFATLLVSLIKLPQIIAEYLFNPKEDKNMVKVIGQIQNYDLQMYDLEQQSNKLRKKQQEGDLQNFDEILNSFTFGNVKVPKNDKSKIENNPKNTNNSSTPDNNAG